MSTHATGEDFLITFRYAENIAGGRGFVYNVGEHVLGSTTPLYTLFLALAAWCHLDAALVGKLLNIVADGLTCLLLYRLLAQPGIGRPTAGLLAAALYAFGSTPISISISGMETSLVTCAGLAAVTAYVQEKPRPLLLLSAVLFLLRIDTLLLTTLLIAGVSIRMRRFPWPDLGLALLVVLPWLIFSFWYFGSPVPTSLVAKLTVYRGAMGASRADILGAFATQFVNGSLQKGLSLLFLIGAADTIRRRDWSLGLPLLWLLLYYGTMLTSHVPAFGWYFLPPWPLYLALAALGLQRIGSFLAARVLSQHGASSAAIAPHWRHAGPAAVGLAIIAGIAHLRSIRQDVAAAQSLEDRVRMPIGLWFRDHAQPNERILLEPIGTIGYYAHRPILDMIGLVSPEVFPSYRTPIPIADIVRRLHPDWLCLRPNEAARLQQADPQILNRGYRLVRTVTLPNGAPAFLIFHTSTFPTSQ
jgi:hypothetical protein